MDNKIFKSPFCNLLWALIAVVFLTGLQLVLSKSYFQSFSDGMNISNAISSSTAVVAVLATILGYCQHKQDEKAKMTAQYNEKYRTDENINDIIECLIRLQQEAEGQKQQQKVNIDAKTTNKREMFFRFIEEVQYLIKKGLIDKNEAYDLFGYYASKAVDLNGEFLEDLDGSENNWTTLHKFVNDYRRYKKTQK